jgi:hypothetical protein
MTKLISLVISVVTIVQIVRPLGLPGLRRRSDAWKLAALGLAIFLVVAATKGE